MAKVTLGIDVGGSTTKIVGFTQEGALVEPALVRAADPVTSVYGALGKFTTENRLTLNDLRCIMITGVGAGAFGRELYGCRCIPTDEFSSVGRGGLYLTGLSDAIVVSMGTGTALVHAKRSGNAAFSGSFRYLGGTGVGGGTLMGLSKRLLGMEEILHIVELAEKGDLSRIDLRIGDIARQNGKLELPAHMTAANFGKLSDLASREDVALGVLNMVFETIGMLAVFAARAAGTGDVVLTGHLSTIPLAASIFEGLTDLFGIRFTIPQNSQYATVIGAALGASEETGR